MIYKIDHYYYQGDEAHDALCLLIESDIKPEHLVKILASIQFKFEDIIDETVCADEEHILYILKNFYNVQDVKEQYKKFLPYTRLDDDEWETINIFNILDSNIEIIQIDLYEARESWCGRNNSEIMKAILPNDEKFELYIKSLKDFYNKRL